MATKRSSKSQTSVSVGQSPAPGNPSSVAASQNRGVSNSFPGTRSAVSAAPQGGQVGQVGRDAIARRAYDIWKSGKGGSELQNWVQAEKELRSK